MDMDRLVAAVCASLMLAAGGCVIVDNPGPVQHASEQVEDKNPEAVRAEIRMGAGELHVEGGSAKLLEADFRYSERIGKPVVRYDQTGFRGRLTIEPRAQTFSSGNIINEWRLRLGGKAPLDLHVQLGAGQGDLDLSRLPLRNLEVKMGAGELKLNLAGDYGRNVEAVVHGGVGEARITLPRTMGVVVDAKGGLGGINAYGFTKKGDRYYNQAYGEDKPHIRLEVRGGVGQISLRLAD